MWKDIKGYEGLYQISDLGRVKSLKKWVISRRKYIDSEAIMNPTDNGHGYLIISLRKGTERKNHYIHRLVADAFVDKKDGCNCVNHIDYNKRNNTPKNLEWCTQGDNVRHSNLRMRKRRTVTHSKTGEQYIYERKGRFRLVIDKKEYPSFATLDEAVKERDRILKEVM